MREEVFIYKYSAILFNWHFTHFTFDTEFCAQRYSNFITVMRA